MVTKVIFRILVFTLVMTASLLTISCSNDEHLSDSDGVKVLKGHEFPVIVNTASKTTITRATYNTETMRLSLNAGDQLLVSGTHPEAGQYAGQLVWKSGTVFEGLITTQKEFVGTAYDLLEEAINVCATLLPNNYGHYGYLNIQGSGFSAIMGDLTMQKAFADTKAHGVEQLSYVHSDSYSNGFALFAGNAILSCTITGLTPGREYLFTATDDSTQSPSGKVTADDAGNASFAVAFRPDGSKNYSVRIGDGMDYHDIVIGAKSMSEGCVYTVHTAAKAAQPSEI